MVIWEPSVATLQQSHGFKLVYISMCHQWPGGRHMKMAYHHVFNYFSASWTYESTVAYQFPCQSDSAYKSNAFVITHCQEGRKGPSREWKSLSINSSRERIKPTYHFCLSARYRQNGGSWFHLLFLNTPRLKTQCGPESTQKYRQ